MTGSILCLDLATQTGWCEGVPGQRPTSGTMRLAPPGARNAECYDSLNQFLDDRLRLTRYRMIVFEAPLPPPHAKGNTNIHTTRRLMGLCEVTEWIAHRHNYFGNSCKEARVDDVRRYVLAGQRPEKGEGKKVVMQRLKAMGYSFTDDNEADAIALWLYASGLTGSKLALMTTPLFNQKQ